MSLISLSFEIIVASFFVKLVAASIKESAVAELKKDKEPEPCTKSKIILLSNVGGPQ